MISEPGGGVIGQAVGSAETVKAPNRYVDLAGAEMIKHNEGELAAKAPITGVYRIQNPAEAGAMSFSEFVQRTEMSDLTRPTGDRGTTDAARLVDLGSVVSSTLTRIPALQRANFSLQRNFRDDRSGDVQVDTQVEQALQTVLVEAVNNAMPALTSAGQQMVAPQITLSNPVTGVTEIAITNPQPINRVELAQTFQRQVEAGQIYRTSTGEFTAERWLSDSERETAQLVRSADINVSQMPMIDLLRVRGLSANNTGGLGFNRIESNIVRMGGKVDITSDNVSTTLKIALPESTLKSIQPRTDAAKLTVTQDALTVPAAQTQLPLDIRIDRMVQTGNNYRTLMAQIGATNLDGLDSRITEAADLLNTEMLAIAKSPAVQKLPVNKSDINTLQEGDIVFDTATQRPMVYYGQVSTAGELVGADSRPAVLNFEVPATASFDGMSSDLFTGDRFVKLLTTQPAVDSNATAQMLQPIKAPKADAAKLPKSVSDALSIAYRTIVPRTVNEDWTINVGQISFKAADSQGAQEFTEQLNLATQIMKQQIEDGDGEGIAKMLSDVTRREIVPADLTKNVNVSFFDEGTQKRVFLVEFETRRGPPLEIAIVAKREKDGGKIVANEMTDLKKVSSRSPGLVPQYGFELKTDDGRTAYVEEFVRGRNAKDMMQAGELGLGERGSVIRTLFGISKDLNYHIPKDFNASNFIMRDGQAVMVDLGKGRQTINPEGFGGNKFPTLRSKAFVLSGIVREFGYHDARDKFIFESIEQAIGPERGRTFLMEVHDYIAEQGVESFTRELTKQGTGVFKGIPGVTADNRLVKLQGVTQTFSDNLTDYLIDTGALSQPTDRAVLANAATALPLAQGAMIKSSLPAADLNRARTTQTLAKVTNTVDGRLRLTQAKDWDVKTSSLQLLDRYYNIEQQVRQLAAQRTDPAQPIKILDWGAGDGTALIDLHKRITEAGIENVQLIGYGDQYFTNWENAPEGVEFIFDTADRLPDYFNPGEIDFIYSHKGLYHLTKDSSRADAVDYMKRINTVLKAGGELRTDLGRQMSHADMALSGFQYLREVPEIYVSPKQYFVKADNITLP
ncbi:MAG: class I SAM-dependent methyltransferase, partial [Candidatus Omnitrophica bacterium]|nr:class I SAM-dependent methyltransferase [Candidatus Omnitrophota bacterium]